MRVATPEELEAAVKAHGPSGASAALRVRGLLAPIAGASPSRVGSIGSVDGGTGSAPINISVTAAVPAGDVVLVSWQNNISTATDNITSITDSRGNTYSQLAFGGTSYEFGAWGSQLTTALQVGDTVTVNSTSYCKYSIALSDYTGVSLTLDGTPTFQTSAYGTGWASASLTTSNASDVLIVLGVAGNNGATDTPIAGWTDTVWAFTTRGSLDEQWKAGSSTGSYAGGGTWSAANNTPSVILALQASGSGPTPNPEIAAGFFAA